MAVGVEVAVHKTERFTRKDIGNVHAVEECTANQSCSRQSDTQKADAVTWQSAGHIVRLAALSGRANVRDKTASKAKAGLIWRGSELATKRPRTGTGLPRVGQLHCVEQ